MVADADEEEGTLRPIYGVAYDDGDAEDCYLEELALLLTGEEWCAEEECWRCAACAA